ncbi:hypothetical protein C8F01DRAFT_1242451 [Mycena amicta]|nr:hypothetical protein C8F01DRAFT_1242451 [Mycena amicta]
MASEDSVEKREWNLDPETEYRFELDPDTSLAIKASFTALIQGNAEVFGAELAANRPYLFGQECKAAIYTWEGCTIEMSHPSTEYVSEETPMVAYANVFTAFEQMRVRALRHLRGSPVPPSERDQPIEPPRVLVVGPENSVRTGQGWSPLLINLDPAEGGWAAPGGIGVTPVHTPLPTSTPASPLGTACHLCTNRSLFKCTLTARVLLLDSFRLPTPSLSGGVAGFIVDTPSSFAAGSGSNEDRQRLIKATIDAFKINTILVVGHEKLNVELQRTYGARITVVKVPKSGGVVELDHLYRERVHKVATSHILLRAGYPRANWYRLRLARQRNAVVHQTMAPSSALPIGAARAVSETQAVVVDPALPGSGLLNAVLAVLAPPASTDDAERYDEEILDLPISGFVVVTKLDIPHRKMTILAPNQGSIVGRTAVLGSYEWQE